MKENLDLNKQGLSSLDWWEKTVKSSVFVVCENKTYLWIVELFPEQPAETNPRQAFGCAPCTWVEQQLDNGGEREESDDRANVVQASSGAGEGVEGQKTAACTSFCPNAVNAAFFSPFLHS